MKSTTMYVTIQEFIENGGVLEKGRTIFHVSSNSKYIIGEYLLFDDTTSTHYASSTHYKKVPIPLLFSFVQIQVTPIYK